MIKEFHSKYNDALREEYDNFGIQEIEIFECFLYWRVSSRYPLLIFIFLYLI